MNEITAIWSDPDQAGASFAHVVRPFCREQWAAGKKLSVRISEAEDERSLQQNAFLWGFVYKHITEQALVEGIGATAEGWHLYYKRMFLGYQVRKVTLPGKKRPSITRELRSTRDLKVKPMSKYLEQVMAHAATTFGVQFPAGRRWEDWQV
jgi:hypothetical protein